MGDDGHQSLGYLRSHDQATVLTGAKQQMETGFSKGERLHATELLAGSAAKPWGPVLSFAFLDMPELHSAALCATGASSMLDSLDQRAEISGPAESLLLLQAALKAGNLSDY